MTVGLDFIRKNKRDLAKEWAKGRSAVIRPDLFDPKFNEHRIVVSIPLSDGVEVDVGEYLAVDQIERSVRISRGREMLAQISNPPSDLIDRMHNLHGHALGRVERKGAFGDSAEVLVQCK